MIQSPFNEENISFDTYKSNLRQQQLSNYKAQFINNEDIKKKNENILISFLKSPKK